MSEPCRVAEGDICWETPQVCDPCLDPANDPADLALFEAAWALATGYVYRKTGWRWPGACHVERVRPCVPTECGCPTWCDCRNPTTIDLAGVFCLPVVEIVAVNVGDQPCFPGGATWTPATGEFRVQRDRGGRLWQIARQQPDLGCGRWPKQDLCRPDGADCTWSLDAVTGCDPPSDVRVATGHFAVEIVKECQRTACSVTVGARRIQTRNVTIERDDSDIGQGLWFDILRDTFTEWGRDNTIVQGFTAPHSANVTSFTHVFGPTPRSEFTGLLGGQPALPAGP